MSDQWLAIKTTGWYCSLLKTQKETERERERDMNTLGGNTLGLLREVYNFVLFRIYGCVVQQSLNENINFVLYCLRENYQWYQSKPHLIMDFELLFILICVLKFISYMSWLIYVIC